MAMDLGTPEYFYLLTDTDKETYRALQAKLHAAADKRCRGFRLNGFTADLDEVRAWAQRGNCDDWKRCCVCGLCYLSSSLGVNSRQLRFLTSRCKSSINGAFKMIGYSMVSLRGDIHPELVNALPYLKGNTPVLRQWSVRTSQSYVPPRFDSVDLKPRAEPEAFPRISRIEDCDPVISDYSVFEPDARDNILTVSPFSNPSAMDEFAPCDMSKW
jgi:hypothetical protein